MSSGVVPVRIQRQFYSPYGEFYCFASFKANKITLNPQDSITLLSKDNNITLPSGRITLKLTENKMRTYSSPKVQIKK